MQRQTEEKDRKQNTGKVVHRNRRKKQKRRKGKKEEIDRIEVCEHKQG